MYSFTDTATTTDSTDVYFPLNLPRYRARETKTTVKRRALAPSLSCGRNRHPETERVRFYGNASGGEAGEARWGGDLWSSELISKALYGTSTQTESHFTPTGPLPSLLHHLKGDLLHLLPITDARVKHNQCLRRCESTAQTWDCSEHKFSWGGGGAYKHQLVCRTQG